MMPFTKLRGTRHRKRLNTHMTKYCFEKWPFLRRQAWGQWLTAQDGRWRSLQSEHWAIWTRDVDAENQPSTCAFLLGSGYADAGLDVGVAQLQDADTVHAAQGQHRRFGWTSSQCSKVESRSSRFVAFLHMKAAKISLEGECTYASVMLVLGSRDTSMTVVPSTSTSWQAVVLRPVTLHAW